LEIHNRKQEKNQETKCKKLNQNEKDRKRFPTILTDLKKPAAVKKRRK